NHMTDDISSLFPSLRLSVRNLEVVFVSVQLAFWLFVVFGLLLYAILARSTPDEVGARRKAHQEALRRQRAAERERVIERRPAAARPAPAARPAAAAPRARPAARR